MPRKILAGTAAWLVLLLLGLLGPIRGQEVKPKEAAPSKEKALPLPATLKVLLPHKDAELSIEGQPTRQRGLTRQFISPALEPGRNYTYTLIAKWEPNNYTKITRKRTYSVQAGKEIEADLRHADENNKDDIVIRWVPTPPEIVEAMCALGKVGPEDVVCDPGCGDGRMVVTAVSKFKAKHGIGVDLDEKKVAASKQRAKEAGVEDKIDFHQGDALKLTEKDVADVSVVLLYMGNDLNVALRPILLKGLKPGSRVVSHRFTMGDWKPDKTIKLKGKDGDDYVLHLWTIGEEKKDEPK